MTSLALQRLRRIEGQLNEISGELFDDNDSRSDAPSALAKKAANTVEDLINQLSVAELMQAGAKTYGREIVPGSVRVLREPVRI